MIHTFIQTLKELLTHPRNVIDPFLELEERKYMHPFLFLMVAAVVVTMVNTLLVDFAFEPVLTEMETENEQMQEIAEWIQISTVRSTTQFLPLSSALILVPMLAVGGLFFFRDYLAGFFKLLVLNSYAVGASMLFQLALIPIWIFSGVPLNEPLANATLPAVSLAIPILWIYKSYILNSSFLIWTRIISTFVIGFVLYSMLTGFAAAVIGYMIFAINRIVEMSGSL
ncbi:DUF3667 domain-containing protein [Rhodohalobacter halophilus]|uniref:DUF3667 domain-containing protein n=1 Tax=Rhodohalobacter halophilus TaxID=1812810 RepID=UPI00083F5F56|nr:DUF3667 domain-containing protein [Rhodohalobacter halophilus]